MRVVPVVKAPDGAQLATERARVPGGRLYRVTPSGRPRIDFNAHRVPQGTGFDRAARFDAAQRTWQARLAEDAGDIPENTGAARSSRVAEAIHAYL